MRPKTQINWIQFLGFLFLTQVAVMGNSAETIREGIPVYPLYAIASGSPEPTPEDLEVLARSFTLVHGSFSREHIEVLHKINPDFKAVRYINSSYTTDPSQIPLVENRYRDALIMFPAARLAQPIGPGDSEFLLEATPKSEYESIALKGSTRGGNVSSGDPNQPSTQSYVTWIRIGDEFMRIEAFDGSTRRIRVMRGFDGTQPRKHAKADLVFSPAYLGSQNLAGAFPGGPGSYLRYGFDPGKPESGQWIARLAKDRMEEGYDGIWLDIMSASAFNLADSFGRKVQPWNFKKNRIYTPDEYRLGQEVKVNVIQNTLLEALGKWPFLVANNMQGRNFEAGQGGLKRLLQATSTKPRPLDGYCIEGFVGGFFAIPEERVVSGLLYHTGEEWKVNVRLLMKCAQQRLSAYPMGGKAGSKSLLLEPLGEDRVAFEDYAYASHLLGVEADFATPLGVPVFYQKDGKRFAYLDARYTWPIGAPAETVPPEKLEEYRVKGYQTYRRRFENGIVLVNPTTEIDGPLTLERTFIDPRKGAQVRSVEMPPHSGKILLIDF